MWFDSNDQELKDRIFTISKHIYSNVQRKLPPLKEKNNNDLIHLFPQKLVEHYLVNSWEKRDFQASYADKDEQFAEMKPDPSQTDKINIEKNMKIVPGLILVDNSISNKNLNQQPTDQADLEKFKSVEHEAEVLVAVSLVRYFNRALDLIWTQIITLIALTFLLNAFVNCYPFQPAKALSQWVLLISAIALVSCLRVMFGMNREGFMARVHRSPTGSSILNFEFLGKFAIYLGPLIALLSAISISVSDILRLILGPLAR